MASWLVARFPGGEMTGYLKFLCVASNIACVTAESKSFVLKIRLKATEM